MPTRRGSTSSSHDDALSSDGDQDYLDALTRKQVLEISEAFDKATNANDTSISISSTHPNQPANKRRRLDKGKGKATAKEPEQAPGGFFVGGGEDDDDMEAGGGGFIRDTSTSGGGGFIVDDDDEDDDDAPSAGGFLPASASTARRSQPGSTSKPSKAEDKAKAVLLDQIPSVLESLGLDGDDPSLLSIFNHASFADPTQDGLQAVKRKDFFKVVALLITQRDNERAQLLAESRSSASSKSKKGKEKAGTFASSGGGKGRAVNIDADEVEDADDHDDSDPLILDSDDEDDEDDNYNRDNVDSDPWADEDEIDGAFGKGGRGSSPASKRRTTRSRAKDESPLSSLPSDDEDTSNAKGKKGKSRAKSSQKSVDNGKYRLSSRQMEECNKMFQQFFPSSDKGRNKAITMAEIRYVATLLNEKISDDDVIEMLEYASSSRDRSVNLDAFSKIMVDVKAV